jgi:hypothetical protein
MRKMLSAAVIGLTAFGGAVIAGGAQAQPYGYYAPAPSGYYDSYGHWHSAPVYNNGYYTAPAYVAPSYGYTTPSYGYDTSGAGLAGALIGSLLGNGYATSAVPVDRYGPDPNGMIAPDGHRIKCKLRTGYDSRWGGYHTYRQCY